jgi:uncharacterized protein YijF (DUF1287 family)
MKLSKKELAAQQAAQLTNEEFVQLKKDEFRRKKLGEQAKANIKSNMGFGYSYKPIQFDYSDVPVEQLSTIPPKAP